MQLTMEQRIYNVKLYFKKKEAKIKFKPSSELCFQNVYHHHQIKPNKTVNMKKKDHWEKLPRENNKTLKRYGKYREKMKEE